MQLVNAASPRKVKADNLPVTKFCQYRHSWLKISDMVQKSFDQRRLGLM